MSSTSRFRSQILYLPKSTSERCPIDGQAQRPFMVHTEDKYSCRCHYSLSIEQAALAECFSERRTFQLCIAAAFSSRPPFPIQPRIHSVKWSQVVYDGGPGSIIQMVMTTRLTLSEGRKTSPHSLCQLSVRTNQFLVPLGLWY